MPTLKNSDIVGSQIGNWIATETPDHVILWVKKKPSFFDYLLQRPIYNSKAAIMATPHYDRENKVPVDLFSDITVDGDADVLQGRFFLSGNSIEEDKQVYLNQIKKYISILK